MGLHITDKWLIAASVEIELRLPSHNPEVDGVEISAKLYQ